MTMILLYVPVRLTVIETVDVDISSVLQQGVRFDPDLPQTLRLEFAKSNTKVTKPKQQSPQPAATHPTFIHPLTGRKYSYESFTI